MELKKALKIVGHVVGKSVVPILETVKFDYRFIYASSLDCYIKIRIDTPLSDSPFCVSPKWLSVLDELNDYTITLSNDTLLIKTSNGGYSCPILSANDFPTHPVDENVKAKVLAGSELIDSIVEAKRFTANDEIRPLFNNIILVADDGLSVYATNMFILYSNRFPYDGIPFIAIIPKNYTSILQLIDQNDGHFEIGDNFTYKCQDVEIVFSQRFGDVPNIGKLFDLKITESIQVNPKRFTKDVSVLNKYTNSSRMLTLEANGTVKLKAVNDDFSVSGEINTGYEARDIKIAVNAEFLKLGLSVFNDSDFVNINYVGISSPLVISRGKSILLMPLSTNF